MRKIRCPRCEAINRIVEFRINQQPVCGLCGTKLKDYPFSIGSRQIWRKIVRIATWPKSFFAPVQKVQLEEMEGRDESGQYRKNSGFQELDAKVGRLIKAAWGSREQVAASSFFLSPKEIHSLDNTTTVAMMLKHVDRIAPRLTVPRLVPRVTVDRLFDAAGQFIEEDGWVEIKVGSEFFFNKSSACAILSHELCHYVLNANGIRERSVEQNERLTDVAMFVFGLGDVFLAGYKTAQLKEQRPGHRVGYLTDEEYSYVNSYIKKARRSESDFASNLDEAETKFCTAIRNNAARERLITGYQRKFPLKGRAELIEKILEDLVRDRR